MRMVDTGETGVEALPEGPDGCRGEDWVRPVDEIDLAKVYRKLILRAGIGTLAPLILAALFISFIIWLMAKQAAVQTDRINIAVRVENIPSNVRAEWDLTQIPVIVTFPQSQRPYVSGQNFSVRLELVANVVLLVPLVR